MYGILFSNALNTKKMAAQKHTTENNFKRNMIRRFYFKIYLFDALNKVNLIWRQDENGLMFP